MKGSSIKNDRQNSNMPQRHPSDNPRAQNKDNLDSREGEEQNTKGSDVTHNRKETHNEQRKQK
jgi:hypothetical protein